jgi:4-hydroxy-3-methylbut-2-enyl diphosphate reductase IspH
LVATLVVNQLLYAANQHQFAMLAIHVLLSAVVVCCTSSSTSTTRLTAVAMQLQFAANQLQLLYAANHLQFAAIHVLLATAT